MLPFCRPFLSWPARTHNQSQTAPCSARYHIIYMVFIHPYPMEKTDCVTIYSSPSFRLASHPPAGKLAKDLTLEGRHPNSTLVPIEVRNRMMISEPLLRASKPRIGDWLLVSNIAKKKELRSRKRRQLWKRKECR